jgi:ribose-phosphate pyrophosphokinase
MVGRLQVFAGNSNMPLAREITTHLNLNPGRAMVGQFRNGETRIKIEENVRGSDVFVIQSLSTPVDHHLMELLIMIDALRRASARRITAVVPYYGYAKQEKKTTGREPITAKLIANLMTTAGADRLLTMDLHAPAIEGFFDIPVDHLQAGPLLVDYFRHKALHDVVCVSPDAGGVGRANKFRERIDAGLAIIAKQRPEADVAEVVEMVGDVDGKTAIIVDDMISTGGTLVEAAKLLHERGAERIFACATHGVFAGAAFAHMADSHLDEILVTNTIVLPPEAPSARIKTISVAALFAESIMRIHKDLSLTTLFT